MIVSEHLADLAWVVFCAVGGGFLVVLPKIG